MTAPDVMTAAMADERWLRDGVLSLRRLGLRELPDVADLDAVIAGTRTLDLSGNRLASLPAWVWRLGYLERLLLGGNRLRELYDGIGGLVALTVLDVSANRLTGLPDALADCESLRQVDVSANALTALGVLARLPSLIVLDAADNRITTIDQLPLAGSLQVLDLSHNGLTDLPPQLNELRRLRSLDLSGNRLRAIPTLTDVPLEQLYLDDNQLSSAPGAWELPSLPRLSMLGNALQDEPGAATPGDSTAPAGDGSDRGNEGGGGGGGRGEPAGAAAPITPPAGIEAVLRSRLVDPVDPGRQYFDTSTKRLDASLVVNATADLRRVVQLYYKGADHPRASIVCADGAQLALDGANRLSALDFVDQHHATGTDASVVVSPDKSMGVVQGAADFLARASARVDAARVRSVDGTDLAAVAQTPAGDGPRVLNVALTDADHQVLGPAAALRPRSDYLARINIGPQLLDTVISEPRPINPAELVADAPDGYWFDVAVSSAGVDVAAELHRMFLPLAGASFVCPCPGPSHTCTLDQREPFLTVPFRTREAGDVSVRCTLYNAHNVIQSARIDARVGDAATGRITGGIDFALTDDAGAAGRLPPRTLNVLTNHAPDGTHTIQINGAGRLIQVDIGEMEASAVLTRIRSQLQLITLGADGRTNQYDDANGKPHDAFVKDLAQLALLGWQLWSGVVSVRADADYLADQLQRRAKIQISRVTRAMFPWAMVYDIPRDLTASWTPCPLLADWANADAVLSSYPEQCPHADAHDVNVLCPYGFWGFRHLIETPPSIRSGTLRDRIPITGPVRATAARSLVLDKTLSDAHFAELGAIFSSDVTLQACDSKSTLQTAFANPALPLVYLYCHGRTAELTDAELPVPCVQIGQSDLVAASDFAVWQRADKWSPAHWLPTGPLVFINGCETARIELADLVTFVDKLAGWDATGVIGTEIPVHQRVAGALADGFYRHFVADPAVPAGLALHRSRIDLLRRGNVAGLAYTAFCSVDLHLDRTPA